MDKGAAKDSDAFGHELWDFYRGRGGYEVIERDDGLVTQSDAAPGIYFSTLKNWPEVERRAVSYAIGKVLDVGCGAGRVALYLQNRKGLEVLGVDISPLAVKVARLRGLRTARLLAFEDIDFEPDSFDSVIMFGNNFGLFGRRVRAKELLRKLYKMTTSSALIICESRDPYHTRNPDHLKYHKRNLARGRMPGELRIRVRYRTYVGKWFDYLMVSPDEMKNITVGTGWRVSRVLKSRRSPLYVGVLSKQPSFHL